VWDGAGAGVPEGLDLDLLTARARCTASIKLMARGDEAPGLRVQD
jgi:hypothetical protein